MSDNVITMPDGSRWSPSTSSDKVHCANCGNEVDTQAFDSGVCPAVPAWQARYTERAGLAK